MKEIRLTKDLGYIAKHTGFPGCVAGCSPLTLPDNSIPMRTTLFTLLLLITGLLTAQTTVTDTLEARSGETMSYTYNLNQGSPMASLGWAWDSQNACFVEPRKDFFTGNHVLFRTAIPKYSTMIIRVIPTGKSKLGMYAYSGGWGALPPELPGCVSCEADFPRDRPSISRGNKTAIRTVELRAVNRPYPVTIGVAGAQGLREGEFTVEITVKRNR